MKNFILSILVVSFFFTASVEAQQTTSNNDYGIVRLPVIEIDQQRYVGKSVSEVLTSELNLSSSYTFNPSEKAPVTDNIGMTHQRYNQFFNGFKVEFAEIIVHYDAAGNLQKINGSYFNIGNVNTSPSISANDALDGAISAIGINTPLWEDEEAAQFANYEKPEGELVILADPSDDSIFRFTWKFDLFAKGQAIRDWVYVDASNGEMVLRNPIIKHATNFGHDGRSKTKLAAYVPTLSEAKMNGYTSSTALVAANADTKYSGSNITIQTFDNGGAWILADFPGGTQVASWDAHFNLPNDPSGASLIPDPNNDNDWESSEFPGKTLGEIDSHYGAMSTWNYWNTYHGRNSYDNAGTTINSYVHVSSSTGDPNFNNAFWNGVWMSYGDGSCGTTEGCNGFDILTALDVCAHEIGHAVTSSTADLVYARESGALNEGFSDIWAAAVEHRTKGTGTDTNPNDEVWLIGDEIDRRTGSVGLRSMSSPNVKSQPDTWRGTFWQPATVGEGCVTPDGNTNDNCGVHTNSGVLNYWFYLLVEGGAGTNDNADAYSVSAIGMTKAELIAFRTLNVYLTNSSDYAAARTASISAVSDLYGACSPETRTVVDAWHAVGVGNAATTIYNGTTWSNGAPTAIAGTHALFNASYNTSTADITACSCEVAMSSTVTVDAAGFLDITGNIKVGTGSTLLVEHEGSVRQINDDAIVTNDGTISVLKTTPMMAAKSFMVSGSPMTTETREGVFGPGYKVRHHLTAMFDPNTAVELVSPGINNWADETGNNWVTHAGLLNPGEGYLVFPQPDATSSGIYTQTHTLGTLTNGVVNFNMDFNGTQNASPSILANPYASAIDAELFFDDPANADIDVVYFWEHLTPVSLTYPGYNAANYDMGDISLYSETLGTGVAAANGGVAPTQFIASGQGFGVKPIAGGMAAFNNAMRVTGPNDTYRSNETVNRDRLWMHVYNDTYGLGSTALIGFTENTSDGYINSEDVHRIPTPVSLYSELETGEELVVNALGTFETEDTFYLSFTTQVKETQDYRISIHDMDGINLENASVYLIDSLTGSVTNLTEGDYTFQSAEAVYHKRFKVVFENSVLGINDSNLDSVILYPNPTQNVVTIVSPQIIVTSATVYDIQGRIVYEVDFKNQTNYQIDLSAMEAALYFIEIATENGTAMKRVVKK